MPTRPAPGAPYQVLDHGFDLFLGHVYILRGAFQGDPVLALCELDVDLPHQNKSWPTGTARPQQAPLRAWAALPGQQPIHGHQEKLERRSEDDHDVGTKPCVGTAKASPLCATKTTGMKHTDTSLLTPPGVRGGRDRRQRG